MVEPLRQEGKHKELSLLRDRSSLGVALEDSAASVRVSNGFAKVACGSLRPKESWQTISKI
jgi:hypothetical protein